jgi:hypothetical protein
MEVFSEILSKVFQWGLNWDIRGLVVINGTTDKRD